MSKAPSQKIPQKILNDPELRDWFKEFTRDVYFMWEQQNVLIAPNGSRWKVDNSGNLVAA